MMFGALTEPGFPVRRTFTVENAIISNRELSVTLR